MSNNTGIDSTTANARQVAFIKKCIKDLDNNIIKKIYDPNNNFNNDKETNYLKPVILIAFDKQFPTEFENVKCKDCHSQYTSDGWAGYRHIHGLDSSYYIAQKNYECKCSHLGKRTACNLMPLLPPFFSLHYPYTLTQKSGVTNELITMMMHDLMNGRSFGEIGRLISSFRANKYMNFRARFGAYSTDVQGKKGKKDLFFGTMDDSDGYNQLLQPSDFYLRQLFHDYYEEVEEHLEESYHNTPIHAVQSIDCTFNYNERAKDFDNTTGKHTSIKEDKLFIAMGGDGQISYFKKLEKEDKVNVKTILTAMKVRCDRLNCPYPLYITCDNAKAWEKTIHDIFPGATVLQDVKHLINRIIEKTKKANRFYSVFGEEIHKCFFENDVTVVSRNKKVYKVKGKFKPPNEIIRCMQNIIEDYRAKSEGDLFLEGFDETANTQKEIINLYISDPLIDHLHVIETSDGKFLL
jgi:hypothetical protein